MLADFSLLPALEKELNAKKRESKEGLGDSASAGGKGPGKGSAESAGKDAKGKAGIDSLSMQVGEHVWQRSFVARRWRGREASDASVSFFDLLRAACWWVSVIGRERKREREREREREGVCVCMCVPRVLDCEHAGSRA